MRPQSVVVGASQGYSIATTRRSIFHDITKQGSCGMGSWRIIYRDAIGIPSVMGVNIVGSLATRGWNCPYWYSDRLNPPTIRPSPPNQLSHIVKSISLAISQNYAESPSVFGQTVAWLVVT